MALFKVLRGSTSAIAPTSPSKPPFHDGYAYFAPDSGRFFIDVQLDSPPTLAHDSGVVDGKTIYRIELEATIWDNILDQLQDKAEADHLHELFIIKGGTEHFDYDGSTEVEIDIRPDWNQTNENSINFIKNKPTIINVAITMDDNAKTMFITSPVTNGDGVSY